MFHGLPFSMASASLTLLLHVLLRERLAKQTSGIYFFHVVAVILGFLVIFRRAPSPRESRSSELIHTVETPPSECSDHAATASHDAKSVHCLS
jgi:hypothetical protein